MSTSVEKTEDRHDEEVAAEESTQSTEEEAYDTEALALFLAELTWDRKALNTTVVDLRGKVSYTDFIVVCTGTSDRHIQAIGQHILREMEELGYKPMGSEGLDSGRWGLLDYGDVIVHIFSEDGREAFDLEGMWSDAPRVEFEEKPGDLYGHYALDHFENE